MRFSLRRTAAAVIVLPVLLGATACAKSETPAAGTTPTQSASSQAAGDNTAPPFNVKASHVARLKAATKD